jgi:hypothetical protein
MMKKLKCIMAVPRTTHVVTDVTIGEIYEQYPDYDDCDDYYVKDNTGNYRYYDKWFFEVVS